MRPLRILMAGGGTGGHLFPAIAIADKIKALEPGADIVFVGTADKLEARVVPERGFAFRTIWISGFHRSFRLSNILFPLKVVVAMIQSSSIIRSFAPDVVVGTGGYVAGPVLRTAIRRRVPTVIQEQNSYPGVTTRMLAKHATEVHITFEQSRKYLSGTRAIFLSGNPTRDTLEAADKHEAAAYFGFNPDSAARTVLILGGSLGAHSVNSAILGLLPDILSLGVSVIWQTGRGDHEEIRRETDGKYPGRLWVGAFIEKMEFAYAAADLVVSRAGATTIAELARLGKPAIFVPYPHAAANHQYENAKTMADSGAARIVGDAELGEKLLRELRSCLEGDRLANMSRNARILGKPEAARLIAERVIAVARRAMEGTTA